MGRIDFFGGVVLCLLLVSGRVAVALELSAVGESTSSVTGSVFSDDGSQRISRANVVLCDEGGTPLQGTSANDAGEFSFEGLRPGHYILRVSAVGFRRAELHVDLSLSSQRGLLVSLKAEAYSNASAARETVSVRELSIPDGARESLAEGKRKLYSKNEARGALKDFGRAIAKAPNYYEAYYQAGMAYLALHDQGQAEKRFRKSVEVSEKKYGDADIALGTLLLQRKEMGEGESYLRDGLRLNPNSWPGQFALGELEISKGHLEAAEAAALKAAQLAPQQAPVYRLLGVIYFRERNYRALIPALDSYIALDPESPAGIRAKELRADAEKILGGTTEAAAEVK